MSTELGADKQQLIAKWGSVAGSLHDAVVAFDRALGSYLLSTALEGPLPTGVDMRRRHAMRIGALAAQGRTDDSLAREINAALDAGLTAPEVVEVIIHTIPYVGIPRALNSLIAAKSTLEAQGLLPVNLAVPEWSLTERASVGLEKINFAHPSAAPALAANLAPIAPEVYDYIVGAAFADIYGRPGLAYVQRQPITIVALTAQDNVQNHVTTHVNGALNIGLSPKTVIGALVDVVPTIDPACVLASVETATTVFAERGLASSAEVAQTQDW